MIPNKATNLVTKVLTYCFVPAVRFKSVVMNQHDSQQIKVTKQESFTLTVINSGFTKQQYSLLSYKKWCFHHLSQQGTSF